MTDPLFDSRTLRFELPLLFSGQAQKETFVNEALSRIDGLLHLAIEGSVAQPPVAPTDGKAWLIAANPGGEWSGRAGQIALRQSGNWLYALPRDGMRLLNLATGQDMRYSGAWLAPARPAGPSGGTVVDSQARTAIDQIISALTSAGIVPA